MTDDALFRTGRRALAQLDNLLGPGAEAFRVRLRALLKESADGRNAGGRLLALLYSEKSVHEWVVQEIAKGRRDSKPVKGRHYTTDDTDESQDVQFSVWHPREAARDAWADLLAYVHVPAALAEIEEDCRLRLQGSQGHPAKSGATTHRIKKETEIIVKPNLPNCRINPPQASVLWLEDWHRLAFRVQAAPDAPAAQFGMPQTGSVSFHVGPLLIGEVPIWAVLAEKGAPERTAPKPAPTITAYRKIFCSYARKDVAIVEPIERAHLAVGDDYWRDVRKLRSGERWRPALLENIKDADIFQLFWSEHARASTEVEWEWTSALKLGRENFIRPVFWGESSPKPPPELKDLNFVELHS